MNTYKYTVNDKDYVVEIEEIEGQTAKVTVNGRPFSIKLNKPLKSQVQNHRPVKVERVAPAQQPAQPEIASQPKEKKEVGAGNKVNSPLPGTISEILVKVGDTVNQGETVLILEAMKMQNSIEADQNGTITSITVKEGDTVMEGEVLFTIG